MKKISIYDEKDFSDKAFTKLLVHDSPYFKIINFNFKAGQELPVHSHDIEGQVSIAVLQGEGEFPGERWCDAERQTRRCPDFRDCRTAWNPCEKRYAGAGDHCPADLVAPAGQGDFFSFQISAIMRLDVWRAAPGDNISHGSCGCRTAGFNGTASGNFVPHQVHKEETPCARWSRNRPRISRHRR